LSWTSPNDSASRSSKKKIRRPRKKSPNCTLYYMSKKVEEWTVLSMLEWATDYFEQKNIPDQRHSIEWLLAETLSIKRLDLYLKFDRPLSPGELNRLRPMVKRRAKHEPLQYIIGFTDFMNARISVNEDVLIPRIETEQLVELILDRHPAAENPSSSVLD